jgi:hypothetical protein
MRKNPPIENQFKPGQSGNPNGRPKKLPELDQLMADVLGEENGEVWAEKILKALRRKAAAGDIRAAEVLLNRGYGMPKQKIELDGEVEINVKVQD